MTIETKTLVISEELKKKVDMICRFACVKYELINGCVINIKNTNIADIRTLVVWFLVDKQIDIFLMNIPKN